MPDLKHMQVKVGIHESIIERVSLGMQAKITLPEHELDGDVAEIAAIAEPASWWTGNLVKYETVVELPEFEGLRPGMSAEVEIFLADYENVITIPVTTVIETGEGTLCWVQLSSGEVERRTVVLGDSDDVMIVVNSGLDVGDRVVLNPRGAVQDARDVSLSPSGQDEDSTEEKSSDENQPSGIRQTEERDTVDVPRS
jgi:multidrug efflux pump subunit AcrA (membrane-fusion protein)